MAAAASASTSTSWLLTTVTKSITTTISSKTSETTKTTDTTLTQSLGYDIVNGITINSTWGPEIPSKPASSTGTGHHIQTSSAVSTTLSDNRISGNTPYSTSSARPTVSPGVRSGAAAGIGIGCAVAGLVIGALVAFFLRRRQRKQRQPENLPMEYDGKEKDFPNVPVAGDVRLDQFLLDSKPDRDLTTELRSLSDLIQQHVESNYHLEPVQRSPNALAPALANLGISRTGGLTTSHLAALALDPRTRYPALQHVIARATFESTALQSDSSISLLPEFTGSFAHAVPPVEPHRGSSEAVAAAFSKWRQLSAFLLNPHRSERTPLTPTEDVSTQQATQLAAALNKFLGPFIAGDRESGYEQENHLREVIVECASLGYVLFSQPQEYRFRFDSDGRQVGIVVHPGLDRVRDEEGRKYPSPQRLATPIVRGI
ncbi:uncharacterized protein BCR38DRAFT_472079 [Pseudomassariella vexata]|uniref:Uncharacterized protein n=1 Tax=Pseudomassariella vexata TaxID=1141098 RepID=A0A1Y2EAH2_9PEZI|nr:uncharacterized protein BCR38DRAFT_472079 [Pseudomassariella vexata]ORY68542.1 hypothetical protein BCR38DRAFT_472079 [Pseudomassariella vexata]